MKHLKHFNEELKPQTYKNAGKWLKHYGKEKRGNSLIDYGHEKDHGFYNVHIQSIKDSGRIVSGKVTNPICNFYYGMPYFDGPQNNVDSKLVDLDLTEEDLVNEWKKGSKTLSFTLEFKFLASEELKSSVSSEYIKSVIKWENFHIFSLNIELSSYSDGLSEFNREYEEDCDVVDLYHKTKSIDININKELHKYIYGIFSDRKSAIKFKRNLISLITPHKQKIMKLLLILGGGSDEIEEIFESFNKIRTNSLYQDEDTILPSKWYNSSITF
jgi:hypothetical protein